MPAKPGIFDNEASAVDLAVYDALAALGWKRGDTLLYQPKYDLTEEEQRDFPGNKSIKPDFVLQDLQGQPLAVIENKLADPQKALPKLRLKYSRILKPRFLYACAADGAGGLKMLFFDLSWRGVDAAEFRAVDSFMPMEEMKLKIEQERKRRQEQEIAIDTTLAGGFDPAAGKERYYQLDCIRLLLGLFRDGKMKMLVHMATGLGKTRTMVALAKALLDHALANRGRLRELSHALQLHPGADGCAAEDQGSVRRQPHLPRQSRSRRHLREPDLRAPHRQLRGDQREV